MQLQEPVIIQVSSKLISQFKQKAKNSFPNEAFAFLLGRRTESRLFVDDLFFPENVDEFCRPNAVLLQEEWFPAAKKAAKLAGSCVLGDIHSHPYDKKELIKLGRADISPSEEDWDSLRGGEIMGICLVTECKDGRLRSRTKFWGPIPQVKVKETK